MGRILKWRWVPGMGVVGHSEAKLRNFLSRKARSDIPNDIWYDFHRCC